MASIKNTETHKGKRIPHSLDLTLANRYSQKFSFVRVTGGQCKCLCSHMKGSPR